MPLQCFEKGHEIPHCEDVILHEAAEGIGASHVLIEAMIQERLPEWFDCVAKVVKTHGELSEGSHFGDEDSWERLADVRCAVLHRIISSLPHDTSSPESWESSPNSTL